MAKGPYYVSEKELFYDIIDYYNSQSFSDRLAKNVLKMAKRIVGSRRFDGCSDLLRDEMISRSYTHCCVAIFQKKYDPKHGSKAYSWISRVLLNECLKSIEEEQRRKRHFAEYTEHCYVFSHCARDI